MQYCKAFFTDKNGNNASMHLRCVLCFQNLYQHQPPIHSIHESAIVRTP